MSLVITITVGLCLAVMHLTFICVADTACPPGKHQFTNCSNPCSVESDRVFCKSDHRAICRPDYCGGCVARFFNDVNEEVHCETEYGFICERKSHTVGCLDQPGTVIKVTFANYGRTSKSVCIHPYGLERLHNTTSCESSVSLSVVRRLCERKKVCTIAVDNDVFGEDPCFGIYKYLEVEFQCVAEVCPPEKHQYTNCSNPCSVESDRLFCESDHRAICRPDYCGGCVARFYNDVNVNEEVHCETEYGFICERKSHTVGCLDKPGTVIKVTFANYGRTSASVCVHPYGLERLHNTTRCGSSRSLSVVRRLCERKKVCTIAVDNDVFGEDPCFGIYKYLEMEFKCVSPEAIAGAPNLAFTFPVLMTSLLCWYTSSST